MVIYGILSSVTFISLPPLLVRQAFRRSPWIRYLPEKKIARLVNTLSLWRTTRAQVIRLWSVPFLQSIQSRPPHQPFLLSPEKKKKTLLSLNLLSITMQLRDFLKSVRISTEKQKRQLKKKKKENKKDYGEYNVIFPRVTQFQNRSSGQTFHLKMTLILLGNDRASDTYFHMNGLEQRLVLTRRQMFYSNL